MANQANIVLQDWCDFQLRHPGHRFLSHDTLYALTEAQVDAIQREIPTFFSQDDEQFERDLAKTASFGFFHGRALGRVVEQLAPGERSLEERQKESNKQIHELLTEELRRDKADPQQIEDYFECQNLAREQIVSKKDAYCGWLVINPQFRCELLELRKPWESLVATTGRFPRLQLFLVAQDKYNNLPVDYVDDFNAFYHRWGLETLLTWDWPVPMEPDLNLGLRKQIDEFSDGGITVFLPWYLLQGNKVDLHVIVNKIRLGSTPKHLKGWVMNDKSYSRSNLGDIRHTAILNLYRYYELVLLHRYAEQCDRNMTKLDSAIASVLEQDVDSVKKLRLHMNRALKQKSMPDGLEGPQPSTDS